MVTTKPVKQAPRARALQGEKAVALRLRRVRAAVAELRDALKLFSAEDEKAMRRAGSPFDARNAGRTFVRVRPGRADVLRRLRAVANDETVTRLDCSPLLERRPGRPTHVEKAEIVADAIEVFYRQGVPKRRQRALADVVLSLKGLQVTTALWREARRRYLERIAYSAPEVLAIIREAHVIVVPKRKG